MFSLQQSDEQVFQIPSISIQEQRIIEDLVMGNDHASLDSNNLAKKRRRKANFSSTKDDQNDESVGDDDQKQRKIMHREIEKQRRQEMATLYASLRNLLPLEYIKGKRAISDHMHESVRYIKHLQNNIQELGIKRDKLKMVSNSSSSNDLTNYESTNNFSPISVEINPCWGGLEIMITSGFGDHEGFPLSRVLNVLLEQGITVVSCVSSKINQRLLHTIQTEVSDLSCVDQPALRQEMIDVLSTELDIQVTLSETNPN